MTTTVPPKRWAPIRWLAAPMLELAEQANARPMEVLITPTANAKQLCRGANDVPRLCEPGLGEASALWRGKSRSTSSGSGTVKARGAI